ncbi:hypothetical protein KOW79_017001 [Hemibagrus wyckioides]|uniref:Uncharacterized protein n=1 Tax=Hemibagrus wyckioides TaxID=337641 RepID=A0A9D3NEK9_9TELE|nr:hypothetical protein KOW79_017001 [Hemibagrus wyckioides]
MLMDELSREVDCSAVFVDLPDILSNKLKPLMENVLTESYHLQHLSEHLKHKELQRLMDEQAFIRRELKKTPHQSLQEEKLMFSTELQEKLCTSENKVQSLQLELSSSQQQLSATEEQNRALWEMLMACEARVEEAEKEKQKEAESKEECEKKMRNMNLLLKGLNNRLELALNDLQGQPNHKAEVEQLQRSLDNTKKEASEMEMKLRSDNLKRMLVCEKACTARELKKSQKKELEFEETLKKLTLRITPLACLIRVKATERENPLEVMSDEKCIRRSCING